MDFGEDVEGGLRLGLVWWYSEVGNSTSANKSHTHDIHNDHPLNMGHIYIYLDTQRLNLLCARITSSNNAGHPITKQVRELASTDKKPMKPH